MSCEPPPEFVAVILAATPGTRLYPLTSDGSGGGVQDEYDDDKERAKKMAQGDGGGDGTTVTPHIPKHLLPLMGVPLLHRLLRRVSEAGFEQCVVAVAHGDAVTVPSLLGAEGGEPPLCARDSDGGAGDKVDVGKSNEQERGAVDFLRLGSMKIRVERLPDDCGGSADALRCLGGGLNDGSGGGTSDEKRPRQQPQRGGIGVGLVDAPAIPWGSHAVVLPGDLILEGETDALSRLADAHRRWYDAAGGGEESAACTVLLSDVGEEDESGAPLKESAKAKKGSLSRDEEDIEYIGVSSESCPSASFVASYHTSNPHRLLLKESKLKVEEDEDMVGATPKLVLPKRRLHSVGGAESLTIRTDLNDLHVYAISPWVLRLIHSRAGLSSLQKDVLPVLISRQYRGAEAAFGSAALRIERNREILDSVLSEPPFRPAGRRSGTIPGEELEDESREQETSKEDGDKSYVVSSQILSREESLLVLRACTLPWYLYGCREVVAHVTGLPSAGSFLSKGTSVAKFKSILLTGATIGEKVQTKSCTVGRRTKLGNRCRLNNVVLMDDVTVGENTQLQNSVVGAGATVGENCTLGDCQVAPGFSVPAGTKEKGFDFTA